MYFLFMLFVYVPCRLPLSVCISVKSQTLVQLYNLLMFIDYIALRNKKQVNIKFMDGIATTCVETKIKT